MQGSGIRTPLSPLQKRSSGRYGLKTLAVTAPGSPAGNGSPVTGSVISRIMISGMCIPSAAQHSKHGIKPSAEPYSCLTRIPYVSSSSARRCSGKDSAVVSATSSDSARGSMPSSTARAAMIERNDGVPT